MPIRRPAILWGPCELNAYFAPLELGFEKSGEGAQSVLSSFLADLGERLLRPDNAFSDRANTNSKTNKLLGRLRSST